MALIGEIMICRLVIFLLLCIHVNSARAGTCKNATSAAIDAATEKIVTICREEFSIRTNFNAIHSFGEKVRNGENYALACYESCMPNEDPDRCGNRFVADFANGAIKSIRQSGKMESFCQEYRLNIKEKR